LSDSFGFTYTNTIDTDKLPYKENTMARKKVLFSVNVAGALREIWQKLGKDARGVDVTAEFKKEHPGVTVSSSQVSTARVNVFGGKAAAPAVRKAVTKTKKPVEVNGALAGDLSALVKLLEVHGEDGVGRIFEVYSKLKKG
jgi:hypothetical protein